jgi:hypothetical protein
VSTAAGALGLILLACFVAALGAQLLESAMYALEGCVATWRKIRRSK